MKTIRKNGKDMRVAAISNDNYACSMPKLRKAGILQDKGVYVNNCLDLFYAATARQAEDGKRWYNVMVSDLVAYGRERGWDERITIAVIALATQVVCWKQTVGIVRQFLNGTLWQYCGHPLWAQIGVKLDAILANPDCAPAQMGNRDKIPAFYAGCVTRGHTDTVCLDRWMFRAILGFRVDKFDDKLYAFGTEVWNEVHRIVNEQAAAAGLPYVWGAQLQAIVWVVIRDLPEWDEDRGSMMLAAPAWKNDTAARADALRAAKKAEAAAKKAARVAAKAGC